MGEENKLLTQLNTVATTCVFCGQLELDSLVFITTTTTIIIIIIIIIIYGPRARSRRH